MTIHIRNRVAAALSAVICVLPLAASAGNTDQRDMPQVVLTDAIRIEVPPGQLQNCAELFQWAFNLPDQSAGFGPMLPEVPLGYGPRCAIVAQPQSLISAKSD